MNVNKPVTAPFVPTTMADALRLGAAIERRTLPIRDRRTALAAIGALVSAHGDRAHWATETGPGAEGGLAAADARVAHWTGAVARELGLRAD